MPEPKSPFPPRAIMKMSAEEFAEFYRPEMVAAEPGYILWGAIGNGDPRARIVLANRLLDDGADATYSDASKTNLIHILFSKRDHDIEGEALLLKRLLDGGADINRYTRRLGVPFTTLITNHRLRDQEVGPIYDVMLASPDLDLNARADAGVRTLRERILAAEIGRPDLVRRLREYDESH